MRPRNAELSLVVIAIIAAFGTGALVDLAGPGTLTPDLFRTFGGFTGLAIVGHIAVRKLAPNADPLLYAIGVLLSGFGLGMIRRLDPSLTGLQLGWLAVGMAAFIATLALLRDHRELERFRYVMMLLGAALLMLPLVPNFGSFGGIEVRGARLWFEIGPLTFQPAEGAKVVLSLFLAGYLAERREVMTIPSAHLGPIGIPAPRHFGPLLMAWGLSLAVMLYQKDLGSSLLFFALFIVALYAATARAAYVIAGVALFMGGTLFAYQSFSHVQARIGAWVDPWSSFEGTGRQIAQSWFALGSGGMTGTGLGRGHPDLIDPGLRSGTLPTDFIYAAIGEELGMLGATAVLMLFGLIVARGFHIALRSRDQFGSLLATALTAIVGLQALLIMGGVTRVFPLTGITLPFVSYGGSSLLANFVIVALLMRISDSEAVT